MSLDIPAVGHPGPGYATKVNTALGALDDIFEGVDQKRNGTTLGDTSLVEGELVIDVTTYWGIDSEGDVYYDDTGVTAGEEAIMTIDPAGGIGFVRVTDLALRDGTPLVATNNLDDLDDVAVARTNLGLGSAALADEEDFATADDIAELAARPLIAVKSANQSWTADTVLSDTTDLSVAVEANTVYEVMVVLRYEAATTGDLKTAYVYPASATLAVAEDSLIGAATATSSARAAGGSTSGTASPKAAQTSGGAGAGVGTWFRSHGILRVGANSGTFKIQNAQNASDATATTVYADSYIKLTKVEA